MAPAPDVCAFRLTDLPVEVVVDIFALAARAAAAEQQGWLCGLARTSRLVWAVVKPVLYETVVIDTANCDHVLSGMLRSSNFLATRHLLIDSLANAHERFSTLAQLMARSFQNVTHAACSQAQLCDFMAAHDAFRPSRFTCFGPFQQDLWARAAGDLPYLRGITHINLFLVQWQPAPPPSRFPFTHVVLTVLHPLYAAQIAPWLLASPRIQRVVVWDAWGAEYWHALGRHGEDRRLALLSHAECARIAALKINRGQAKVYRPMVTFDESLWVSGHEVGERAVNGGGPVDSIN